MKRLGDNGLNPVFLVCRTEEPLYKDIKRKIAQFCNVTQDAVIEAMDADTIYSVPLEMMRERLDEICLKKLSMDLGEEPDLTKWKEFLNKLRYPKSKVTVGLIGKYVELQDAYKSILEAFIHAGVRNECQVEVVNVHSESISSDNVEQKLGKLNAVLVAPGFGARGIEGKICAIQYVRENNIPFLGICLGMQCAVVEFARNVLGLEKAGSSEVNPDVETPVITLSQGQDLNNLGGTMRLGTYDCSVQEDSKAYKAYNNLLIEERHRHRWEFNNDFWDTYNENGMKTVGINPPTNLVEIVEIEEHPFFIGVQFHPDSKSTGDRKRGEGGEGVVGRVSEGERRR